MSIEPFISVVLGGAIAIFSNYFLEKSRAKNDISSEQYKNQLKKSEFFFHKQFDASLEFGKFFYEVLPEKQSVLDEWEDAMSWLADNLQDHKKFLDNFIAKYNVLFSSEVIDLIENASYQVVRMNDDKDSHEINSGNDLEWADNKWRYADDFYEKLKKANEAVRNELKEQVNLLKLGVGS